MEDLLKKIENGRATVGVIGLGYVGLPLAAVFHRSGLKVRGYDVDERKVTLLSEGKSYIKHIGVDVVKDLSDSIRFQATTKLEDLAGVDIYVMCLPTPLGTHEEPDMSYVFGTSELIAKQLMGNQLFVLESTTYPGATDTDVLRILTKDNQLEVGTDLFLAFSPERENPAGSGDEAVETSIIPKLVGGVDESSGVLAAALYRCGGFKNVVKVKSARIAECSKLLENSFRVVNIALVNELKLVFEKMDVDIWEVLDAAETKPFGFKRFNPGPGVGGHCIPIDPFYLTWKAKEVGQRSEFIEISGRVNASMPSRIVDKVQLALNDVGKAVKGSKVMLIGIAYKPNVDDCRESPALKIWELLLDLQAAISYHDSFIPKVPKTRTHKRLEGVESVAISEEILSQQDAVVIVTDHDNIEYDMFKRVTCPVIDTRNRLRRLKGINVVLA
ncbi:hypothetical protein NDN08_007932 [Rhodosorus marinus]|uniref:UDP-glucose/GDP-mannose dehydrogenase C-terminal domain-containing protein n=1 Tax=Rhodosorus marinus TaxID=101924 RepID=A0AAV8V1R6_9RHOD|nr:hypothetical protein NDN08_007932 [Rhodosorus marinus]